MKKSIAQNIIYYTLLISVVIIFIGVTVYILSIVSGFKWIETLLAILLICISVLIYRLCNKSTSKKNDNSYWENMKCTYYVIAFALLSVPVGLFIIDLIVVAEK